MPGGAVFASVDHGRQMRREGARLVIAILRGLAMGCTCDAGPANARRFARIRRVRALSQTGTAGSAHDRGGSLDRSFATASAIMLRAFYYSIDRRTRRG